MSYISPSAIHRLCLCGSTRSTGIQIVLVAKNHALRVFISVSNLLSMQVVVTIRHMTKETPPLLFSFICHALSTPPH